MSFPSVSRSSIFSRTGKSEELGSASVCLPCWLDNKYHDFSLGWLSSPCPLIGRFHSPCPLRISCFVLSRSVPLQFRHFVKWTCASHILLVHKRIDGNSDKSLSPCSSCKDLLVAPVRAESDDSATLSLTSLSAYPQPWAITISRRLWSTVTISVLEHSIFCGCIRMLVLKLNILN